MLWFGKIRIVAPIHGSKLRKPQELQEQLEALLSEAQRRKISVNMVALVLALRTIQFRGVSKSAAATYHIVVTNYP